MMRDSIVVTGGAGFIGANFIRHCLSQSAISVVNVDKLTYAGNLETLEAFNGDPRYKFVRADICDTQSWRTVLNQNRPRAIVNFAAETHVDRSIDNPDDFVRTNVVGVQTMLNEALSYQGELPSADREKFRVLHVSTDEVYGSLEPCDPPFTELSPFAPNSPYAASKAAADHLVRAYFHTYRLNVLTTNCSNNYGPYQYPEKLVPLVIRNALAGRPLPVYGDGLNVRDWLYVGDHCEALWKVLAGGTMGETYNIGGNCEKSNIDTVSTICSILDELMPGSPYAPHAGLIEFVRDRPGHDRRYAIDAGKIASQLGWKPRHSFETALRETVRWYIENVGWSDSVMTSKYDGDRLGLAKVV